MRKTDRQIKTFDKITDVIERCDTIRLGINDEPYPYVVPLSFGYETDGDKITFYVHGAKDGLKHELIAKSPNVCVEGDICHCFLETSAGCITCSYESFIGRGTICEIAGDEAEKALDLLLSHCGFPNYPYNSKVLSIMKIYKIEVTDITGKRN